MKFVKRIVVAWLATNELPAPGRLEVSKRTSIWDAISNTATASSVSPMGSLPRNAFPHAFSVDDAAWAVLDDYRMELARWTRVLGWQPDAQAFWVETSGSLSCVGVDGTISPRLYLERRGLIKDAWLPATRAPHSIVPLAGRRAHATFEWGDQATIDGSPSAAPFGISMVPATDDRWMPLEAGQPQIWLKKLDKVKTEQRTIVIKVPEWSETGCIAAITTLTAMASNELRMRAIDGDIRVVFQHSRHKLAEDKFFHEVQIGFPGAAAALNRLIETFSANHDNRHLFWNGRKGIGALGHAVLVLGIIDASALPAIRRYGFLVDAEHESFFTGTTVPAILKAHGWTDDVIDFMTWVMLRKFYNSLHDYNKVWKDWRMRDAVVAKMTPRAFADRVRKEIDAILFFNRDPARFGSAGMDQLHDQNS